MRKSFLKNTCGATVVLFAAMSPVFLACAALTVDVGTFFLQKRALQGATDLAAMAAAQNPTQALVAAQRNLALNGFPATAVQGVQFGAYAPNSATSAAQWFTPVASGSAVQVRTQIQARYYFATILSWMAASSTECTAPSCGKAASAQTDSATITAAATAMIDPQASFAIGSDLASLNGGVLNAVLGGFLGSNLSFSLLDYRSLANANIDLFAFSNALAMRMNLTAATYNELLNTEVAAPVLLTALADAANVSPGVPLSVVDDLNSLAGRASNQTIAIGQLLSLGEYGSLKVNSPEPITATADALDMVSAIAQIANGQHQVQAALNINIAPIASASLAIGVGERPVGSGFVSVGSTGATVHTAQTRLLLTLQIAQIGSSSLLSLPIYMELAPGTATLSAINCSVDPNQTAVTLNVTPAVIDAWVGAVSVADMTNYSAHLQPGPTTLLNVLGLGAVSGRANATITNLAVAPITFSHSDIVDDVRRTTSMTDFVSSLLYNLFANLQLTLNIGGIQVSAPAPLASAIGASLATAAAPVDQVISATLNALGLSLGNASTWVNGLKCGSARLVL